MPATNRTALVVLTSLACYASQAIAQGRAQEAADDLLRDYTKARVLWTAEDNPRARTLFGTLMTRGETAAAAADSFISLYGEAFVDGDPDFERVRSFERLKGGEVFHYQQFVEGMPVDGSVVRVMVHDGEDFGPAVVYASGHFARPPVGGLPDPRVTARDALAAAKMHPAGRALEEWADPELVVTTTAGVLSRGEARLAWRVYGWTFPTASWGFWVDAVTSEVFRDSDRTAHYRNPQPSVSGTVTGGATPSTEPDKGVGHRCGANLPQTVPMPELVVEITNAAQTVVLDSAMTDANGDYEFFGMNYPADAKIRFTWDAVGRLLTTEHPTCQIQALAPEVRSLGSTYPVTHNHDFNPSPYSQPDTALVNVHLGLNRTREFLLDRLPPNGNYPELHAELLVVANHCFTECNARYMPSAPAITYGRMNPPACDINSAYSTIIPHKYGHYIADRMLDIPPNPPHGDFHEGFGDTLAMLIYEVTVYAENWKANCDPDRTPLTVTPPMAFDCEYSAIHDDGMLLAALWLDIAAELELGPTRQLFVDWMLLTAGGIEDGPAGCENDHKAAGPATLIEVLLADDDDGNLATGTPNGTVICEIFEARGITINVPCDNLRQRVECAVDLDGNRRLDVFDFLTFFNWFDAGDPRADWNGDGVLTAEDATLFEKDFRKGC